MAALEERAGDLVALDEALGKQTPLTPAQQKLATAFRKKIALVNDAVRRLEASKDE